MQEVEVQSYDWEDENVRKEEFVQGISKQVASFFNQIIYQINLVTMREERRSYQNMDSPESKPILMAETRAETGPLGKKEGVDSDISEMRSLSMQYKQKQDKLDNRPKKPVSSFFLFYQQNSKNLLQNGNEVASERASQRVADAWNKLSPQEKQPYNDRAKQDKDRYKEEMNQYIQEHSSQIDEIKRLRRMKNKKQRQINRKKENGEAQQDDDQHDSEINMRIKGISQRQMKAAERKNYSHRPKAPVSSFFLYYQDQTHNIAQQYGQAVGSKIARIASGIWKKLPKEDKVKYQEAADIERKRYHQEMTQYKIDYPEEVESRRQKISNNMKRTLRLGNEDVKEEEESSSESLGNLSDSNSIDSSPSQNSYISEDSPQGKNEAILSPQLKTPSKRQKKDKEGPMPHRPKGPICSFFQYYHANIKQFMKKDPNAQKDAGSEFVKRASIKWNTLSEDQKQPYHEMAKEDRLRYRKDMDDFKTNYPQQYGILKDFNKNKQLKKKNKKLAKLDLQDELADIVLQ